MAHDQRRAGGALRAVEWSELTARLNAARDLRLLLRTESQAPIGAVAASFGDAVLAHVANEAIPGVEITLFSSNLTVSRSAVLVPTSPG